MHTGNSLARALVALLAVTLLTAARAGWANASALEPRGKKVFFGVSDTGNMADFGHFSSAVRKHPALIESFRTWGSDFPASIERGQTAGARPLFNITPEYTVRGRELIVPCS